MSYTTSMVKAHNKSLPNTINFLGVILGAPIVSIVMHKVDFLP